MVLSNIVIKTFKVAHSLFNHMTQNLFNSFEVMVLLIHALIIQKIWGIVFTIISFASYQERGENNVDSVVDLIGKTNTIANYISNFDFLLATAIVIMCFRCMQIFEFSLSSNVALSTLYAASTDILNWLVIFILTMIGEAVTCYIVFSPSLDDFATIHKSMFTLVKLLAGDFRIIAQM